MRGRAVFIEDFSGGLDLIAEREEIAANASGEARDCFAEPGGPLTRRGGSQAFATITGANPIHSISPFNALSLLVAAGDIAGVGKLWTVDQAGVATDRTPAAVFTGSGAALLVPGARMEWVQAAAITGQGPLYGCNGFQCVTWDGITATMAQWVSTDALQPVPIGRYLAVAGERLWMAAPFDAPPADDPRSLLAWSELGNPRLWPPANRNVFKPRDGEEITGIAAIGGGLIVFKRTGTWFVYDLDTGANHQLSDSVGCVSHRSIAGDGERVYFLTTDRGPYVSNGSTMQPVPGAERLKPVWQDLKQDVAYQSVGVTWRGRYLLALPRISLGGSVGFLYEYNPRAEAWWEHDLGAGFYQLTVAEPLANPLPTIYGASVSPNGIQKLHVDGVLTDYDSSPVGAYFRTRHDLYRRAGRKRVRRVAVDGTGLVDLSLALNGADLGAAETRLTLNGAGGDAANWAPPDGPARTVGVGLRSVDGSAFSVDRVRLDLLDRKD